MNAVKIKKMLENIKADYVGMGRHWHENDDSIMELLVALYYQTEWLDWEEIQWLFVNYLENGILDFSQAERMAHKRLCA